MSRESRQRSKARRREARKRAEKTRRLVADHYELLGMTVDTELYPSIVLKKRAKGIGQPYKRHRRVRDRCPRSEFLGERRRADALYTPVDVPTARRNSGQFP